MAAKSMIGVGILGGLAYNERQHGWAIELGQWLGSFIIAFTRDHIGDQDVAALRPQILTSIDRILFNQSFHLTAGQLWASCDNDAVKFAKVLLDHIQSLAGSTACVLVIIGQCACGMRSTIPSGDQDAVDRLVKSHLRDIEHRCPNIGIGTEALGTILLQQSVEDLGATGIDRLLANLSKPLTVLIMSPDPQNANRLRLAEERRELDQAIRQTRFRDSLRLYDVPSCRARDITDALDTHSPNILHFSGHGTRSGLCFEDDRGELVIVEKTALANVLGMQRELKLVVLNACYSQDQAQAIADAVGYVVGMDFPILDQDSITFSREFYRALGYGRTFEEAFNRANSALGLTSTLVIHLLKGSR